MASDNSTLRPGPARQSSCYTGFPRPASLGASRFQRLPRHYRVIAPDLRGYGETDKAVEGLRQEDDGQRCRRAPGDARRRARRTGRTRPRRAGRDPSRQGSPRAGRPPRRHGQRSDPHRRARNEREGRPRILVLYVPPGPRPAGGTDRGTRGHLASSLLFRLVPRSDDDLRRGFSRPT